MAVNRTIIMGCVVLRDTGNLGHGMPHFIVDISMISHAFGHVHGGMGQLPMDVDFG